MQRNRHKAQGKPLDAEALWRLAVHYVGRYATTQAKLSDYLQRKLRERGWMEDAPADLETVVARCVELGYVDDRSFAEAKAGALNRRGYGAQRIGVALKRAGIERGLANDVMPDAALAEAAAETYARRKRIGAFGDRNTDPKVIQRQIAAMVRAGHPFELARRHVTGMSLDPFDFADER